MPDRLIRFVRRAARGETYAALLGGPPEATALNRWAVLGLGARQSLRLVGKTLTIQEPAGTRERCLGEAAALFAELRAVQARCRTWNSVDLPFHGGLMGVLGYEFYPWCDPALFAHAPERREAVFPELLLVECRDWLVWDLAAPSSGPVILSDSPERAADYRALWAQTSEAPLSAEVQGDGGWRASLEAAAFEETVARVQAHIRAGDLYQANLSIRLEAERTLDPYAVFSDLCRRNPSPFSGLFRFPGGLLVCNSPERLVRLDETGRAETRPIAGTRGRGRTPGEDAAIGEALLANEKERAEHLMLVDLARNDLGRVCAVGTVEVDELLALERYSHVTHLVSNVRGRLAENKDAFDLLAALFPGGTITGCPKIRCIELLKRYEPVPRGWYTGSLGYIDALSGAMDFNILIRSLYLAESRAASPAGLLVYNAAIHAGAGIVADSIGPHEYRESRRKAQALLQALEPR